jgi:class 3 adenylate cyclase
MMNRTDVRESLPMIVAPTLVVHRAENQMVPVEHGRDLASRIENAELIEVEGADHPYWAGNADDLLEPIERLLTGAARPRLATRVLTTVMFTDLVSSTQELERHGDVGWKRLLERHDAALLHLVGRFGGTYVNTTGDGMVATFDMPSRALGCAVAIRSAARQLALGVRIGLHTGEIRTKRRRHHGDRCRSRCAGRRHGKPRRDSSGASS